MSTTPPIPLPTSSGQYGLWSVEVVAKTIYGEARGESPDGRLAVAWVIRNRAVDTAHRWPRDVADVCLQPKQFSCWNVDDPNRNIIIAEAKLSNPRFVSCLASACIALAAETSDPTLGANHYHARAMASLPSWAASMKETAKIGGHVFYRG